MSSARWWAEQQRAQTIKRELAAQVAVRRGWIALWLIDLERGIPGPWDRDLSLAIDLAHVEMEQ